MPSDPFYRSAQWRAVRAEHLRRFPNCQVAGHGDVRATNVDHVKSRRRGGAPFDHNNLRSLCQSCHSRKTAAQDGGFGNPLRTGTPDRGPRGCDARGYPTRWLDSS